MDRVEQAKIIAKYMLDRVIPIYKENLHNDFNLDNETKEKLTKIYNRTNEEVLKTVLAKYQAKLLKQEENSDIGNFNIEVPVISKIDFTKSERLYLLSLYIDKLIEYDFESLGLTSIDIIKKYIRSRDIDENKVYDITDKYDLNNDSYSLKLSFSLIKTCIKDNHNANKVKVYSIE